MTVQRTRATPTGLRLLVAAYAVSSYGSYLNLLALGLFAFHLTGSALQTGLFMALRLGSGFVAGPVAGLLAGRHPRRPLMIGADLLSAAAILLLVALPSMPLLYALGVVLGATQTQWGVAMRSSVPELVGAEHRTRANSHLVTGRSVAMLLGFASAGALVSSLGYRLIFLIDAASFAVCAVMLLGVPIRGRTDRQPKESLRFRAGRLAAHPPASTGGSTRALLATVAPVLLGMMAVRTADAFSSASHNVALPLYANLVSPADPAAFAAAFTTSWAVGSLAAGRWLARGDRQHTERGFAAATVLMSVFFVLAFTGLPMWLLIPVAAGAGVADGYAEISYTSRLQEVADGQRAQLFGLAAAAQNAGFGVGMVGCAVLLDRFAPLPVVGGAHAAAMLAAAVFLLLQFRSRRLATAEVIT